jgi:hypothetical protein
MDLVIPGVHVGLVSHPDEQRYPIRDDPAVRESVRVVKLLAYEVGSLADVTRARDTPRHIRHTARFEPRSLRPSGVATSPAIPPRWSGHCGSS